MNKRHITALCGALFLIFTASCAHSNNELADNEPADSKRVGPGVLTSGFNHVGLTVSDLDASVEFFTNTLGWRVAGGYEDYPSVFVTDGNMFVTLWRATHPDSAVAFNRKNNVGLHHLAISVTSREALDVLYERFIKAGNVDIEFAPELNGKGPTVHMMIREPSGNRLEFAFTPASKP